MRQIDGRLVDGRLIDAESTGGAVLGLRVAIGAGLLALGWLVLGSVAGSASAAELDIGDGSLLGPGSSLVTEPIALSDVVTDAAAVPKLTEPVSQNVRPVLESVKPVLEPVQPVLEPVLDAIQPVLQSVEPVLNTVGIDPTVFGTLPESILAPPERVPAAHCVTGCDGPAAELPTDVPGDIRPPADRSAAAIAPEDPVRHAPAPSGPSAPMVVSELSASGASGGIALASDVAERGWVSGAPSAPTTLPGDDIPPASPTYDSDSTPD